MTEEEAWSWIYGRFDTGAIERMESFAERVIDENSRQNLIAPSTISTIWSRHMVDSLQLILLAPPDAECWLDIGTGGGFPGMVIALAGGFRTHLVEPRRRRADFLRDCVEYLDLSGQVIVHHTKVENVAISADVISARAVGDVDDILRKGGHCSHPRTRWILPRGVVPAGELEILGQRWSGEFHVEHSITNAGSSIAILDRVTPR